MKANIFFLHFQKNKKIFALTYYGVKTKKFYSKQMFVINLYQFFLGVNRVKNKKDASFLLLHLFLLPLRSHISDVYVRNKITVIAGKFCNTVIFYCNGFYAVYSVTVIQFIYLRCC